MFAIDETALNSGPRILLHIDGSDPEARPCILLGLAMGKMHVRSDQPIEPASHVSVSFSHLTFAGEVLYCTYKETWYRICIDLLCGENQRRREPRLTVNQPGNVIALSDRGSQPSTPGTLLDLAVSGMRLAIPHEVQTGSMIYIETATALIAGEVRRCERTISGTFEVGIEISDVLPNSKLSPGNGGLVKNIRTRLGGIFLGKAPPASAMGR